MYTQTHIDVNTDSLLPRDYTFGYSLGMGLANRLQDKMDEIGISQYALANISGVPQPTICRILNGSSVDPRRSTLAKLASALQTTVEDLIYEKTDKVASLINDITAAGLSDDDLSQLHSLVARFSKENKAHTIQKPKTARVAGPPAKHPTIKKTRIYK